MGTDRDEKVVKVISSITASLGSTVAIIASIMLIVVWAVTGPLFGFSEVWQLVINTTTTIITFIMVFVIQNSQNRDGKALQTKLDAILDAVSETTDQDLMDLEDRSDKVIDAKKAEVTRESS